MTLLAGHQRLLLLLIFPATIALTVSCSQEKSEETSTVAAVNIVPQPVKLLKRSGTVTLTGAFWVISDVSDSVSSVLASMLVKKLEKFTGKDVYITDLYSTRKHKQAIHIEIDDSFSGPEGAYTLDLTSPQVKIKAGSQSGIVYGIETLLQVLQAGKTGQDYTFGRMIVKDQPRLPVRGILMPDSSVSVNLLQAMQRLKLNTLYLETTTTETGNLQALARQNYIRMGPMTKALDQTSLLETGKTFDDIEGFLKSYKPEEFRQGTLLKLASEESEILAVKLLIYAELSWSGKVNQDLEQLKATSRQLKILQ